MSKFELKPKARDLRMAGESINNIAKKLNLSKSTISLWCSEMKLSNGVRNMLRHKMISAGLRGRLMGAKTNRNKKLSAIKESKKWAKNKIKHVSDREFFIANIALYWAEGSKSDSSTGFIFVNSDPDMILFVYKWLTKFMGIPKNEIKPILAINYVHKERVNKILKFWSNLLDLPLGGFGNTYFVKTPLRKLYDNHNDYHGVLRMKVLRSTNLKYKILALIDRLKLEK